MMRFGSSSLQDPDDDVRLAAANVMLPLSASIVTDLPDILPHLTTILWSALEDLKDDLSASVGAVVALLADLLSKWLSTDLGALSTFVRPLPDLIPILFSYFRHTIASVRLAILEAFTLFLNLPMQSTWIDQRVLSLLFQNTLFEDKDNIRDLSIQIFQLAASKIDPASTQLSASVRSWIALASTPLGKNYDQALLYRPSGIHGIERNVLASPSKLKGKSKSQTGSSFASQQDLPREAEDKFYKGRLAAIRCLCIFWLRLPSYVSSYASYNFKSITRGRRIASSRNPSLCILHPPRPFNVGSAPLSFTITQHSATGTTKAMHHYSISPRLSWLLYKAARLKPYKKRYLSSRPLQRAVKVY